MPVVWPIYRELDSTYKADQLNQLLWPLWFKSITLTPLIWPLWFSFLAEYKDEYDGDRKKGVIFSGDAHSSVLEKSIAFLLAERGAEQLKIDALKVSHHGSKANTSPDLLKMLRCRNFLFSTNGSRHEHPDPECIARILTTNNLKKNLHFNYRSDENKMWGSRSLARKYDYQAHYPDTEESGILITL